MAPDVYQTEHLILRIEDEDRAAMVLALYENNRPEFEEFEPTRPVDFYTLDYHIKALRREYKAYRLGSFVRYYIYRQNDEHHIIGSINFNIFFDGYTKCAEMGYKIDHLHQNRGYAYEACVAGMKLLASYYDIQRFDVRIHPDNIPSLCLAGKLNFKYMYIEPNSANIMGRNTDLLRYTCHLS